MLTKIKNTTSKHRHKKYQKKNTLQGASVPAASDPHSPLLLPPGNILDLDSLLPHIGQCLRGDGDDGDEEETKSKSEKYKKNPCIYRGGGQQEERSY